VAVILPGSSEHVRQCRRSAWSASVDASLRDVCVRPFMTFSQQFTCRTRASTAWTSKLLLPWCHTWLSNCVTSSVDAESVKLLFDVECPPDTNRATPLQFSPVQSIRSTRTLRDLQNKTGVVIILPVCLIYVMRRLVHVRLSRLKSDLSM